VFAEDAGYDPKYLRQVGYHSFAPRLGRAFRVSAEAAYVGTKGTRLWSSQDINLPVPGPGDFQPRRPFPEFLGIGWQEFAASSAYHALQLKAERRFSADLALLTSFTWSKSIDENSDDSQGVDPLDCRYSRARLPELRSSLSVRIPVCTSLTWPAGRQPLPAFPPSCSGSVL
jgi:hypothetical protein